MTKVVRPRRSCAQRVLDLRLALAVEARGGFVQDQDARVGKDGAGDRHALPLAAREAHAALADDGVVLLGEALDELVAVGDACRFLDLVHRGVRLAVADVLGDGAVEEEVVLQHDAEVRAVARQAQVVRGRGRRCGSCPWTGRLKAITRLTSVLLPEPLEPTSAVVDPAGRRERDALQHRHARVVLEPHVVEDHLAAAASSSDALARPRRPRPASA